MSAADRLTLRQESDAVDDMRIERPGKTLRELTLEKMRDAILDGRFRPGERLVERNLCERLAVSRTVVREVLRHLETEGLVEILPQQGPAVARPDPKKAAQIYEIRGLLEGEAARTYAPISTAEGVARLAACIDRNEAAFAEDNTSLVLKGTNEFYEALFHLAGKDVAWSIVQSLNMRINHLRALTISEPGRGKNAIAEMRAILAAISSHDAEGAYRASIEHIKSVAALAARKLQV
ncbi:GntR family transcriptional regulator [Labrys miyagiensis]|uniref:GntR family transcriptional regulator n=1 Tax=Labrys miyagiensis TaxID=346912 RepID=A0ABQ6CVK9_9HYPH|nr:GntR family transcriptional regulator [Labrys miyagiensis]GLS24144.1 GntR family transcriptional regulator [Labrys miyagiensis]